MAHQLEVTLPAPLRAAELVDPAAPLPPLPPRSAASAGQPGISADAISPSSLIPPSPPPEMLWETEIGKQLLEDRTAITTTLARVEDAIRALQEQRRRQLLEWQQAAIELGLAIASRLVHERIEAGGMALETVVREAAARLDPDEPVSVRLNPQDVALLVKRLDGAPLLSAIPSVQVVADAALARGDCHVVGREGSVISEVRTQLAALRSDLLEKPGHAGSQS